MNNSIRLITVKLDTNISFHFGYWIIRYTVVEDQLCDQEILDHKNFLHDKQNLDVNHELRKAKKEAMRICRDHNCIYVPDKMLSRSYTETMANMFNAGDIE